jgi:thiol:disulfide interchange protein DsbA
MIRTLAATLAALAVTAAISLHTTPVMAQSGFDPEGKYALVQPPQPTDTGGKVEVVEMFWYGCPHCFSFLPAMERYEKSKADYVEIRRMPAVFRKSWENHARAYYTAKLLGVEETIHRPLFEEIHTRGRRTDTPEALRAFFVQHGVDGQAFDKTFDSFAVETMLRKSVVMQGRYGVRGTPSVIVNGKYRTSGSLAGSYEDVLKVVEALAERERTANMASTNTASN